MSQPHVPPRRLAVVDDASSPDFVCTWKDDGVDAAWVHVAGELDLATTPHLQRTLGEAQAQARMVVLDLRELSFMDSSGVHVIVDASIRARQAGRRLVLLKVPPNIDRTFELTGTTRDIEIGYLDPGEPPVQVLLQLADEDSAA